MATTNNGRSGGKTLSEARGADIGTAPMSSVNHAAGWLAIDRAASQLSAVIGTPNPNRPIHPSSQLTTWQQRQLMACRML